VKVGVLVSEALRTVELCAGEDAIALWQHNSRVSAQQSVFRKVRSITEDVVIWVGKKKKKDLRSSFPHLITLVPQAPHYRKCGTG
jgi:hypothetical protein